MKTFTAIDLATNQSFRVDDPSFPFECQVWQGAHIGLQNKLIKLKTGLTHFGILTQGKACLQTGDRGQSLYAKMYWVSPTQAELQTLDSSGMIISMKGKVGYPQLGGPIEPIGRLNYIDGCSDTLLICPTRLGEPCLNHLHIPPHTDQTQHTHPSDRIGVILTGYGHCLADGVRYPLEAGMGWYIPAGCKHSFFTQSTALDVIAWHPDSDFGPEDHNHPMINRTEL